MPCISPHKHDVLHLHHGVALRATAAAARCGLLSLRTALPVSSGLSTWRGGPLPWSLSPVGARGELLALPLQSAHDVEAVVVTLLGAKLEVEP